VREAVEVLEGRGEARLTALCIELAAGMVCLAGLADGRERAIELCQDAVRSGKALMALKNMVAAQGGDLSCLDNTDKLPLSPARLDVTMPEEGYIACLKAEDCGLAAMELGAGRERKEDSIDYGAGVVLLKNRGDYADKGEPIARLYAQTGAQCQRARERLLGAITVSKEAPKIGPLVIEEIGLR